MENRTTQFLSWKLALSGFCLIAVILAGAYARARAEPAPNRLGLPASGTVFTLEGLDYNLYYYMPNQFRGIFRKRPYKIVKVYYPASFANNSISNGVANLNAALRSTPGQKIVLAHSQGAQVASRWMRKHAKDPAAPKPNELTFVLFGNPLRSDGKGYIIGRPEVGGTEGAPTPTDTPWHIIDVARRYEGWADWPGDKAHSMAQANANAGKFLFHPDYAKVNIHDPKSTVWNHGNTTYVLTKEGTLPMLHFSRGTPDAVIRAMRRYIESAYSRPPNDPRERAEQINDPRGKTLLKLWGVPPYGVPAK